MNLEEEIKKKPSVASNGEIVAILFVFITILFFIFPKDNNNNIERLVLNENSNYDLSISYLKTIISTNPDKKEFKIALARIYQKAGKERELYKLLEELNLDDFNEKEIFYPYYYKFYSDRNRTEEANRYLTRIQMIMKAYKKEEIEKIIFDMIKKKKIKKIFNFTDIYIKEFKPNKRELKKLYQDLFYLSNSNKKYEMAEYYLKKLLQMDKREWAKPAIYFYQDRNQTAKVIEYMEYLGMETNTTTKLSKKELKKEELSNEERLAYLYIKEKNYEKAIESYQKLAKIDPKFYDNLGYVYELKKDFINALRVYQKLFDKNPKKYRDKIIYLYEKRNQFDKVISIYQKEAESGKREDIEKLAYAYMRNREYIKASREFEKLMSKRGEEFKYFKLAVDALMANREYKEIYNLLQRNEDKFIKDETKANYILKLYLAINRLDGAKKFTKKMFK